MARAVRKQVDIRTILRNKMRPLVLDNPGIESWLLTKDDRIYNRLIEIENNPLSKVQLSQLFVLAHEAGISDGFFEYYWLASPDHSFDVTTIDGYDATWIERSKQPSERVILSLEHLRWGLYRLYVDALLYFGNVRFGYRFLRTKSYSELEEFFKSKCYDTQLIKQRGPHLALENIDQDARYLISEIACKTMEAGEVEKELRRAYSDHQKYVGEAEVTIQALLDGSYLKDQKPKEQGTLNFTAHPILEERIRSLSDLDSACQKLRVTFNDARAAALHNTELYLSEVNDLDVYVATSMRTVEDFRQMAEVCSKIFQESSLINWHLRYFDPTVSAAEGHEDKGLIECLMVKCAKVLIYCAGGKDSYGKDSEAAMALSLGKPVIFYCDQAERQRFLREIHPLSRLIHFETGVVIGAMVVDTPDKIALLIKRIFENKMQYELNIDKVKHLQLIEKETRCVVRLQTGFDLLRETFWNYYHGENKAKL